VSGVVMIDLSEITLVVGQKNSGKSVLLSHIMGQMSQYICLDPLFDHNLPDATPVTSVEDAKQEWKKGNRKLITRVPRLREEKAMEFVEFVSHLENTFLIIDESNMYMSSHSIPQELSDFAQFYVSHKNNGLILACRQLKDINTDVITQVDNTIMFSYSSWKDSKFKDIDIPPESKDKIVNDVDPESHRYLFVKHRAGFDPEIREPVPLPDYMS